MNKSEHKAVLTKEVIENLEILPSGVYVDCTLGGGEHSLEILTKLKKGTLISLDLNPKAIDRVKKSLLEDGFKQEDESLIKKDLKVYLLEENFENLENILSKLKIESVNGIIADLGWSSDQLKETPGLSFEDDSAELDMRFGKDRAVKASDLLMVLGKKALAKIFLDYADFNYKQSKNLAEEISAIRNSRKIEKVRDIKEILKNSKSFDFNNKNLARFFQALRIAVNLEFAALEKMIIDGFEKLKEGGVIEIITFHSGEFNRVKDIFEELVREDKANWVKTEQGKKFFQPSLEELKQNINSRSARLLIIKKI